MEVVMFTYFSFGKMSFDTKVGMKTDSNIAVAPNFQLHVCKRNLTLSLYEINIYKESNLLINVCVPISENSTSATLG